jgi:hypothetical protein
MHNSAPAFGLCGAVRAYLAGFREDATHQPREKLRMASARRSITGRAKVRLRTTKPSPVIPEIQAQAVIVSSPYSPSGTGLIPTFLLILPKASAGAR